MECSLQFDAPSHVILEEFKHQNVVQKYFDCLSSEQSCQIQSLCIAYTNRNALRISDFYTTLLSQRIELLKNTR